MAQGLGPGLRGWFAADEAARQQNASQLQQLQGILGIQGMLQKQQQAKAYESELGALGPNPDQGALSSLMMKYGGPQAALHSLDRSAAREVANTNAAAMREQRLHEIELRGMQAIERVREQAAQNRITKEEADRREATMRDGMARLAASLRQPVAPTITEVADPADPTRAIKIDARTGAKIGDAPPKPPTAAAVKASDEASKEQATVESVRQRVNKMSSLIQGNTGVVGPAGVARRVGEAAVGVVAPGVPTPAIDYENEKNLLLADVRKLVEKDPNLSNQERETLSRTLGGGTMQTPGSAIRTLNNVLGFIENKKLRGPSRRPAPPAVGSVVSGYKFKGGDPSQESNWERQ